MLTPEEITGLVQRIETLESIRELTDLTSTKH